MSWLAVYAIAVSLFALVLLLLLVGSGEARSLSDIIGPNPGPTWTVATTPVHDDNAAREIERLKAAAVDDRNELAAQQEWIAAFEERERKYKAVIAEQEQVIRDVTRIVERRETIAPAPSVGEAAVTVR